MKLEDERSDGGGELELLLGDLDNRVRARAALAMGRLGDPSAALKLTPLLTDPSPYVRATAAFSLGILEGPLPEGAAASLTDALDDEEPRVRGRVAEALARVAGENAAEALGAELARWVPRGAEPYEWNEALTLSSVTLPHPDVRAGLLALGRLRSSGPAWGRDRDRGSDSALSLVARGLDREPASRGPARAFAALLCRLSRSGPAPLRSAGAFRTQPGKGPAASARAPVRPERDGSHRSDSSGGASRSTRARARSSRPSRRRQPLRANGGSPGAGRAPERGDDRSSRRSHRRSESVDSRPRARGPRSPGSRELLAASLRDRRRSGVGSEAADGGALRRHEGRSAERASRRDARGRGRARSRRRAPLAAGRRPRDRRLRFDPPSRRAGSFRTGGGGGDSRGRGIEGSVRARWSRRFSRRKTSDPRIRASLLKALSTLDPEKARPTATGALEDPSHFLRKAAASILARAGVEASVRPRSSELGLDDYQASLAAPFSPQAFITTSRGRIEIELFIADAPQTVSNFIRLARDGFFTGNRFYEVVPNGHVATGDPRGDGRGGPGYVIRSELNERPVVRGTLAMVEEERDSGGSRFLITHLPEPALEGRLTVFGLVTAGMEVVDRLEPSRRHRSGDDLGWSDLALRAVRSAGCRTMHLQPVRAERARPGGSARAEGAKARESAVLPERRARGASRAKSEASTNNAPVSTARARPRRHPSEQGPGDSGGESPSGRGGRARRRRHRSRHRPQVSLRAPLPRASRSGDLCGREQRRHRSTRARGSHPAEEPPSARMRAKGSRPRRRSGNRARDPRWTGRGGPPLPEDLRRGTSPRWADTSIKRRRRRSFFPPCGSSARPCRSVSPVGWTSSVASRELSPPDSHRADTRRASREPSTPKRSSRSSTCSASKRRRRERSSISPPLLEIELASTMAIGDNWNDVEMLERAGLGVIMKNADPELRSRGFAETGTNEECGVAEAIERYLLGP